MRLGVITCFFAVWASLILSVERTDSIEISVFEPERTLLFLSEEVGEGSNLSEQVEEKEEEDTSTLSRDAYGELLAFALSVVNGAKVQGGKSSCDAVEGGAASGSEVVRKQHFFNVTTWSSVVVYKEMWHPVEQRNVQIPVRQGKREVHHVNMQTVYGFDVLLKCACGDSGVSKVDFGDVSVDTNERGMEISVHVEVGVGYDKEKALTAFYLIGDSALAQRTSAIAMGDWCGQEESAIEAPFSSGVSLMCSNIWNYNYWHERMPLIEATHASYFPSVIGFQEVRTTSVAFRGRSAPHPGLGSVHQAQDLFELLGGKYSFVFEPAMGFAENNNAELVVEGIGIFTRLPILSTGVLRLSREDGNENDFHQRIVLHVCVQTEQGARLHVLNTHFSHDKDARRRSLQEIGELAEEWMDEPVLLMGDFNHEFDSDDMPNVLIDKYGFVDAWKHVHGEHVDPDTARTFRAWEPSSRIDYMFYRPGKSELLPSAMQVVGREAAVPMPGKAPIGGVEDLKDVMHVSDHFFLHLRLV